MSSKAKQILRRVLSAEPQPLSDGSPPAIQVGSKDRGALIEAAGVLRSLDVLALVSRNRLLVWGRFNLDL